MFWGDLSRSDAVIYVLGGISQKAHDVPGELALLLDILDLALHHSATCKDAEVHNQAQLISIKTAAISITTAAISIKTAASTSGHAPERSINIADHDMDIADMDTAKDTASAAKGAQMPDLADCVLWGLHAVKEAAKMVCVHKSQACSKMLSEYVLERMVLFSKDWPLGSGQVTVEVRLTTPCRLDQQLPCLCKDPIPGLYVAENPLQ